jgi:uncharacterized FAD-dependent dehydrogenase
MENYDVIIVGAGPAGIFAALELVKKNGLRVLVLEKGKDLDQRFCPARQTSCVRCVPCDITSGWGGAGAFSDGKLTLSSEVGGWLGEYLSEKELRDSISYVDDRYREFGADAREFGTDEAKVRELQRKAVLADLTLVPGRVRHLGTERCYEILRAMKEYLSRQTTIETDVEVKKILTNDGKVTGVLTSDGREIPSGQVIVAPGREGADWLAGEARRLGLKLFHNAVDIGVRVEVPAAIMEPLTSELYESKLIYYSKSFQDRVRTFCMNPQGTVSTEIYGDVVVVNGHSYADIKTDNTNFALLVSTTFTEPFREPIAYGKYIARLANLLGEGIIIQRLGDLQLGRRSTRERIERSTVIPTLKDATPGDLSFVLPYRYLSDIQQMLEALDKVVPGVNSRNTLLYGVEVKFYSSRLQLNSNLETEIENLYAVGDGAGVTRGLIQASVAGTVAARSILNKG